MSRFTTSANLVDYEKHLYNTVCNFMIRVNEPTTNNTTTSYEINEMMGHFSAVVSLPSKIDLGYCEESLKVLNTVFRDILTLHDDVLENIFDFKSYGIDIDDFRKFEFKITDLSDQHKEGLADIFKLYHNTFCCVTDYFFNRIRYVIGKRMYGYAPNSRIERENAYLCNHFYEQMITVSNVVIDAFVSEIFDPETSYEESSDDEDTTTPHTSNIDVISPLLFE